VFARGITEVDCVGIAANAQEPVDRFIVEYSEYLVCCFEFIAFSEADSTIETELGPFSLSNP
jgi:hypothetical protein